MSGSPGNTGYVGAGGNFDDTTDFNAMQFLIGQRLAQANVATFVKLVSCTNAGGITPVGSVDVLPMVNQVDGAGNATPHGVVHGLPYVRIQGGTNAVIIDPVAGDKGMVVFCDRDISSVKANKETANPGSQRRNDMADGVYIGGGLNAAPVQYIAFTPTSITMVSPTQIILQAPNILLDGDVSQTGTLAGAVVMEGPLTVTNDATISGRGFLGHEHVGVQSGASNTGTV